MKKYIGTKMIEAEKAFKVGDAIYSNENNEIDAFMLAEGQVAQMGYKVRYPDGYESFSPKKVFEKAYRPYRPEDIFVEKARDLEAEYEEQAEKEKACEECTGCIDECRDAEEADTAEVVSIHVYDRDESVWASVVIDEKDCHIRGNCEYLTSIIFDAITKETEVGDELPYCENCFKTI